MSRPRRAFALVSVGLSALASSACIEPQTLGTLKGVEDEDCGLLKRSSC